MTKRARAICKFCAAKTEFIDYKNVRIIRRYIQVSGKLQPARYSHVCAGHQRMLTSAAKNARMAALIPFVR